MIRRDPQAPPSHPGPPLALPSLSPFAHLSPPSPPGVTCKGLTCVGAPSCAEGYDEATAAAACPPDSSWMRATGVFNLADTAIAARAHITSAAAPIALALRLPRKRKPFGTLCRGSPPPKRQAVEPSGRRGWGRVVRTVRMIADIPLAGKSSGGLARGTEECMFLGGWGGGEAVLFSLSFHREMPSRDGAGCRAARCHNFWSFFTA